MVLDPSVVFLTSYECPGCGAELELPAPSADSWLRCPRCGRPSEPPDFGSSPKPGVEVSGSLAEPAPPAPGSVSVPVTLETGLLILSVVALVVDLVLRFLVGVDPMVQMVADVAAFLTFSLFGYLVVRWMVRP